MNRSNIRRNRRRLRNRANIMGTSLRPRLSVFRSNRHMYGQLIDDEARKTLASASTKELQKGTKKLSQALKIGELLAERAKKVGIKGAVFNKGSYRYHGRIKAVAEGARKSGLNL